MSRFVRINPPMNLERISLAVAIRHPAWETAREMTLPPFGPPRVAQRFRTRSTSATLALGGLVLSFIAIVSVGSVARSQDAKPADARKPDAAPAASTSAKPKDDAPISVTDHEATIGGAVIKYSVEAGKLAMKTDEGKTKANIFYIAYRKSGVEDVSKRPITFCFNGGPGSASVWLHLGMMGPQRIKFPDDASLLRPPYRLQPNPFSLLDITDMVFIDPVSTGYSRPADGENKSQFHGYDEDLASVGQFIHDYTTQYQRWSSPKLLMGESYGGIRAAGLAGHLQDRYRLELNGIVLVSAVIDFETLLFGSGTELPYFLFLPTYTATAWYHKALPADLQQLPLRDVVKQSEQFALDEYAPALLKDAALTDAQRAAVAEKLARYTGLSKRYVEDANLRISMGRFGKELLRQRKKTIGRFDSRYQGVDRDHVGETYEYDASGAAIFGPFTATFNEYVRGTLKYKDDRVYEILTGNVQPWSYKRFENRYADATETLRRTMTANPHLRVFAACGYYDLATPHFAMDYTLNHLGLPSDLRSNLTTKYYEGGHMMYIHEPSLQQLRDDLIQFYKTAAP